MALVLSFQLLTGTGIYCVSQYPRASRSVGGDPAAVAGTTTDRGDVSATAWKNADGQGGTLPCSCKKKKKCPTIPRATLTSNPTYRFYEVQRQSGSVCCDSLTTDLTDHRFAFRSAPPFMKCGVGNSFYSSDPLSITCVLLI